MNKDQFAYLNETIVALESQLSQVQRELEGYKKQCRDWIDIALRRRNDERDALKAEKAGLVKMLENRQKRMSVYREALEHIAFRYRYEDLKEVSIHGLLGRAEGIATQALSSNEGHD